MPRTLDHRLRGARLADWRAQVSPPTFSSSVSRGRRTYDGGQLCCSILLFVGIGVAAMTAIAGVWRFDGRPNGAECCMRMLASQEMYGLGAGAQWSGGDMAMGRRLMRLLPEDVFDCQPLVNGEGRYVLVADI